MVTTAISPELYLGETIGFWIQTLGFWIQTGAICLSVYYASKQVINLAKQSMQADKKARQRCTIDAVLAEKKETALSRSRMRFAEMKRDNENFTALAIEFASNNKLEDNEHILNILNNYEFMAAGIREGALDEDVYKRMKRRLIIKDWQTLDVYIAALRKGEGRCKLFVEFQWLAEKWAAEDTQQ